MIENTPYTQDIIMPKAQLDYYKCTQCRKDRQKCLPRDRVWPDEKCARCIKYKYNCSANVSRRGELPPAPVTPAPSVRHNSKSTSPVPLQSSVSDMNGLGGGQLFPPVVTPVTEQLTPPLLPSHGYPMHSSYPYPTSHQRPVTSSASQHHQLTIHQPSITHRRQTHPAPRQQQRYTQSSISFNWLKNLHFNDHYGVSPSYISNFYTIFNRRLRSLNSNSNSLWEYSDLDTLEMQRMILEGPAGLNSNSATQLFSPNVSADWGHHTQQFQHQQASRHSPLTTMPLEDQSPQSTIHLTPATSNPTGYLAGQRWRDLIEGMGGCVESPEILLLDPNESAQFINKLENGTDEEFYILKSEICAPGSVVRDTCLKLSGVARMISEIEEGKHSFTHELRHWIGDEIERRIKTVIREDPPVTTAGRTLQESNTLTQGGFMGLTGLTNEELSLKVPLPKLRTSVSW